MYQGKKVGWLVGVAAVALVAGLVTWGHRTQAASDNYVFVARGIVTEVNHTANTVRMAAAYTSASATNDLSGTAMDYNVNGAKFYKWQNNKKVRVTWTKSAQVGDEIVIRGTKKNDRYTASWLVVNERNFTMTGRLIDLDKSNRKMTISVITSTYKPANFNGKDVTVYYRDNSKFYARSLAEMEEDALRADNQKVKIVGAMEGNNFKFTKLYDDLR